MFKKISVLLALYLQHLDHVLLYTIPPRQNLTFPYQGPYPGNNRSFIRINPGGQLQILNCPKDFIFSHTELKCVYQDPASCTDNGLNPGPGTHLDYDACPADYRGLKPNPRKCREFFSCWDGTGWEMECGEFMNFNADTGSCDWPENAGCCEFLQVDPNIIVAPRVEKLRF